MGLIFVKLAFGKSDFLYLVDFAMINKILILSPTLPLLIPTVALNTS